MVIFNYQRELGKNNASLPVQYSFITVDDAVHFRSDMAILKGLRPASTHFLASLGHQK